MAAYQVLARKWRPKTFDNLKGQSHVVRALMNAIRRERYHHAYLFTGTRGVGKTTLARIVAKAFNCELGITPTPCGRCAACVEIEKGRYIDLLEVDAASRTRVEDTRELLENVQYAPTQGRFKIYLIDEVHMLSGHSFNALLKTLEEPPAHVIFILATTEPEKIPVTVLSRCLRFNLRPLSVEEIVEQLEVILVQENIAFEPRALHKIAFLAQGSMRDALSLLEQVIAFSEGSIQVHEVETLLGISYERQLPALIEAIVKREVGAVYQITAQMAEQGVDFERVCSALQRVLCALACYQQVENARDVVLSSFLEVDPVIFTLKDKIVPEELQLLYQLLLIGKRDLPFAPDPKTGFDMLMLRMMVFQPGTAKVSSEVSVIKEDWSTMVSALSLTGLSAVLVKHCVVSAWNENQIELTLEAVHQACLNEARVQEIQRAISQHLGRAIRVKITPGEIKVQTPLQQIQAVTQQRDTEAERAIQEDPLVNTILSTFDGKIEKITRVE